jgi:hypothetical protein
MQTATQEIGEQDTGTLNNSAAAWVLFLEPASDSLYTTTHLNKLDGVALVEFWDRHFAAGRYSRGIIVAHPGRQSTELLTKCSLYAELHVTNASTMTAALAETVAGTAIVF